MALNSIRSKLIFGTRYIWLNAGCPSNGVLQQIKRKTKLRFNYAVRSIKRRQDHIKRVQLADSLIIETLEFFGPGPKISSVVDGACALR